MKIITELLFNKIADSYNASLPFVAYRFPKENQVKGFFQKDDTLHFTKTYSEPGFVFAPFDDAKASIVFPLAESEICTTAFLENATDVFKQSKMQSKPDNAKEKHIKLVQNGIDFLKITGVKKVVLSRKEVIDYPDLEIIETFKKLLISYSNAMVYVWFHPKVGLWLGATPETLLKVQGKLFTTMSLAGTQIYKGSLDVVWQQKEKQEQQFVTDYLLEKLGNDVIVSKPQTIKAGNLIHLCTDISGKLSQEFTLNRLIKLLHPTPAVCGMPKDKAKTFILENETYDRGFYTGFLGELNLNKETSLFVNLRCMQVLSKQIVIYIGGGITVDSNPKMEWEETVDKSKVMLKVLG